MIKKKIFQKVTSGSVVSLDVEGQVKCIALWDTLPTQCSLL